MTKPIVRFHLGGPAFHPVEAQARMLAQDLGDSYVYEFRDGPSAFEQLDDVALVVPMGLHWTGMNAQWAGELAYTPLAPTHLAALHDYVGSGRPLLCYHGGIASYDDRPAYGALLGYQWRWDVTTHTSIETHSVTVSRESHPLLEGVGDFALVDELYYNVQVSPDVQLKVLGQADFHGARMPMIFSGNGGRVPGSGRTVYLANGHDLRAWECPAFRRLCANAVRWLVAG